jgi:hypothetical protein
MNIENNEAACCPMCLVVWDADYYYLRQDLPKIPKSNEVSEERQIWGIKI